MRTLYYIPIIHTDADMGSLSKPVTERGIRQFGAQGWGAHVATVHKFWDTIADYCAALPARGMKIYQDGLVADGDLGAKIVAGGVQSGSRNYEIVERLRQRGAEIVKTEDFRLVLEERDRLLAIVQARTFADKIMALFKYRLIQRGLLRRRDAFMARRIADTLAEGGAAVLFVGAYHRVRPQLPEDIKVIEVKATQKVRDYQAVLPFSRWRRRKYAALGRYLEEPVPVTP